MEKHVQIVDDSQMQNLIPLQAGLVIVKNAFCCMRNQNSQESGSSRKKRNRPY